MGQHAGLAGNLLGEFPEGGRIHHSPTGAAGTRLGDGHPTVRGNRLHGGINELVQVGGGAGVGRGQGGQVPATQGRALPGAHDHCGHHMIRPALAQTPGAGDTFGHIVGAFPGRAGQAAQRIPHRIGQDRAEGGVALGHAGDGLIQVSKLRIGGTINGAQAELHTQVQQQLVPTRRHAFDQSFDRIGGGHLVGPHLGPQGDEHGGRVRGAELNIGRHPNGRGCRGQLRLRHLRQHRRGHLSGGSISLDIPIRIRTGCSGHLAVELVGGKHNAGFPLHVENLQVGAPILRQGRGLRHHIGQGWGGTHAYLHEPVHTQAAVGLGSQQQILGFNPPHRGGKLPSQQLHQQGAG